MPLLRHFSTFADLDWQKERLLAELMTYVTGSLWAGSRDAPFAPKPCDSSLWRIPQRRHRMIKCPYSASGPLTSFGEDIHGTYDRGSVQDLSQWRSRPQEPLPHNRQQHVWPTGSEWRREEFADADSGYASRSRLGFDYPRWHQRADAKERDPEDPGLSAAGVWGIPEDVSHRHAEPFGRSKRRNRCWRA